MCQQQHYWCCKSFYLMNSFLLANTFSDCFHLLAKYFPLWIEVVMFLFSALVLNRIHTSESYTTSYLCTLVAVELLRHKTTLLPVHKETNVSGFSYAMQASLTFICVQHFCQKIISKTNNAVNSTIMKNNILSRKVKYGGRWCHEISFFLVERYKVFRKN